MVSFTVSSQSELEKYNPDYFKILRIFADGFLQFAGFLTVTAYFGFMKKEYSLHTVYKKKDSAKASTIEPLIRPKKTLSEYSIE